MADTTTTNLALTKPEVGASTDTWGTKINTDLDSIDALFDSGPYLKLAKGGTGAGTAANARTNLGLATMAVQAASAVAITGGTAAGLTINSSPIGQGTPAAGQFTSLGITGTFTFNDGTTQVTAAGTFTAGVQSISTNTSITASYQDHFVEVDATAGAVTVTVFTPVGNTGRRVTVKKIDSSANAVIIAAAALIDGNASISLFRQYDAYGLYSNGTTWRIN